MLLGTALGLLAGFYGGLPDNIIMRLADIQLAFPFVLLAIAMSLALGPSIVTVAVVLMISSWPMFGRLVRGEVLSVKEREYVTAARSIGTRNMVIIAKHILPNVSSSIIVFATLNLGRMILLEAALSFLGLGVQPPTPSWGTMVYEGQDYLTIAWWISTFPGLLISLLVISINILGDSLRDTITPTS
jgi:peptide/nickel transport system permease protein